MIEIHKSTFDGYERNGDFFLEAQMKGLICVRVLVDENIFLVEIWNIDALHRSMNRSLQISEDRLSRISSRYIFTDLVFDEKNTNLLLANLLRNGYFHNTIDWQSNTWGSGGARQ